MRILIVEDDYLQADYVKRDLIAAFKDAIVEIFSSEYEFRNLFDQIAKDPPDLIIIDLMLVWCRPTPDMSEVPEEVRISGFSRAGFRCLKMLQEKEETSKIPVILYSVLDRADISAELEEKPPHVLFLSKSADVRDLILRARSLVPGVAPGEHSNWWQRVMDSVEAKPGAFGFKVDLKRLTQSRKK